MIRCSFRNAWCQSMPSLAELMLFMSCVGVLFRTIPKQSVLQWWGRWTFRGRKPLARWDWDILRGARRVKTTQFLIKDNADYWKLYSFERKWNNKVSFEPSLRVVFWLLIFKSHYIRIVFFIQPDRSWLHLKFSFSSPYYQNSHVLLWGLYWEPSFSPFAVRQIY